MYRGGRSEELAAALEQYVEQAAARLPHLDASVALVLDVSASTRGYGEREYAAVAQSVALQLVLRRCGARLRVYPVGGLTGEFPPQPDGSTDLAGAALDALDDAPDAVAIVTDGYENVLHGDLAQVLRALPALGIQTPVVMCHSAFSPHDDLTHRRPAPGAPEVTFWHEDDFEHVVFALLPPGDEGVAAIRAFLLRCLEQLEAQVTQEGAR
jgi:hypothetical protein